jgi:hypothetical protein
MGEGSSSLVGGSSSARGGNNNTYGRNRTRNTYGVLFIGSKVFFLLLYRNIIFAYLDVNVLF